MVFMSPRQLGPRRCIWCLLQIFSSSFSRSRPSSPVSLKPAEMTMSPFTFFCPASFATIGTISAGTATTPKSIFSFTSNVLE